MYYCIYVKYATMVCMERAGVRCVVPVSTTLSVTMSTEAVYRGVIRVKYQGDRCDEGDLIMGVAVKRVICYL